MQKRRKSWQIKSLGVSREYTHLPTHMHHTKLGLSDSLFCRQRYIHTYVHADVYNVYTKCTRSIYITRAIYVSISNVKLYARVLNNRNITIIAKIHTKNTYICTYANMVN